MPRRYLPALRGLFGDWAYYSCLMSLSELAERVSFADELHKSKALSNLIQRKLRGERSKEIAEYLLTVDERFFNSLVVAVYGGDPAWHALAEVSPQRDDIDLSAVSEQAIASLGFLSFSGNEKLFALDGQHRLSGIRDALRQRTQLGEEEVSVLFVSHHRTSPGLRRTRQLFTTLNKTAKPVNKAEIIALDESDVMAITVRYLVENHPYFSDDRILVSPQANLPTTDNSHLTTIINLYDVLAVVFAKVHRERPLSLLQRVRPSDKVLEEYADFAVNYFTLLGEAFGDFGTYLRSKKPSAIIARQRRASRSSVLFRPVGQTLFAQLAGKLTATHSLDDTMELLGRLPVNMSEEPYVNILWHPATQTLEVRRQALVRRLLLYMLDFVKGTRPVGKLRGDLAKVLELPVGQVQLPEKVV